MTADEHDITPEDDSATPAWDREAPTEITAQSSKSSKLSWESLSIFLLLLTLVLGAYFRYVGLDWDNSYHLHPDERFLTDLGSQLRTTSDPLVYLTTSESPLNPYNVGKNFYVYGNFPMTVTRYVAEWVTGFCANFESLCHHTYDAYDGIHLVGRALSGAVDLLSVLLLFFIGRRLYDWRVGLLAAFLQTAAVMPIQQSHFFTMDNWAAALTTLSIYFAVRAAGFGEEKVRWELRWWVFFGISLGLAVASRINMAPLALVINISAVIWLVKRGHSWDSLRTSHINSVDVQRVIISIALAAAVSAFTFRVAQPYAFADGSIARQSAIDATGVEPSTLTVIVKSLIGFNPQWLSNMEEIQRLQTPDALFPPALQWTSRTPILFPLVNMLLYGMGLTAGLAAWIGLMWALWRVIRQEPEWLSHIIPVFWSGAYFLFMGTRWVKSVRYFLPVYPTLFLMAGWLLFTLWERSKQGSRSGYRKTAVLALFASVAVPSLLWANSFVTTYQQPITRVAASSWMYENMPSGATLLYEVDGEERQLQLPLKQHDFFPEEFPLPIRFTMPEAGRLKSIRLNYVSAIDNQNQVATLRLSLDQQAAVELNVSLDDQRRRVNIDFPDIDMLTGSNHQLAIDVTPGSGPIRADTSHLLGEHWDDLLPVSMDGRNPFGSYYVTVTNGQVPVTNPDSIEKREDLISWLDEADYILLSSQRAVWHLPRLPLSFPLMIRYYGELFDGNLGFDLVSQFHADYSIGPIHISDTAGKISWGSAPQVGWPPPGDLAAEEAFSVYDHPPVWIFAKSDRYQREDVIANLNVVELGQPITMTPGQATQAPNGLLLSQSAREEQQNGGTFGQLFNPDGTLSQHPALAAVVWWLAVILMGWLAFPISYAIFDGLPERGYGLSRIFALLFVSYFAWLLASNDILPHTRATIWLGVLTLAAVSGTILIKRFTEIQRFVRLNLRTLLVIEVLGLLLYLIFIGIRLGNPDMWDVIWGGEKPMDLAYFTAVLKSTSFPPYDPWFAGGYINYYYYGYVFVGALVKLLGLVPTVAYNLILPMLYSFTGVAVFSTAYNLVASRESRGRRTTGDWDGEAPADGPSKAGLTAGAISMALAVLLGNLAEADVLFKAWNRAGSDILNTGIGGLDSLARTASGALKLLGGQPAPIGTGDWFWNASRAINFNPGEVVPITEFPYFTFLYGDLHAHMISLPLMMLALGWAVSLVLGSSRGEDSSSWWSTALRWAAGGVAIGALRATNTWDWPTYLVLGSLAVGYQVFKSRGRLDLPTLAEALLKAIGLIAISILAFLPFAKNFGAGYSSFKLWPGSYTNLANYLTIYGLFLLLIVTHLAREIRSWARSWTAAGIRAMELVSAPLILALLIYVVLLVLLLFRGYWIAPVVLTLTLVSGLLGLRKGLEPARRIILILTASALGITLFVEFFVLEGDIGRMNTVFKFYVQVWLLLSVVAGVVAVWAWPSVNSRGILRTLWQTAAILMLLAAALYPVLATKAKWQIRMSKEAPNSLDGMAFMNYVSYEDSGQTVALSEDYHAIQWMQRHIDGSPVVAEAHSTNPYRSIGNRISMYTGLPAIVGWDWHQRQQRAVVPSSQITNRISDVNRIYNGMSIAETLDLLKKYDVGYIYSGRLEQVYYSPIGLQKFDLMVSQGHLQRVYYEGSTSIYKVLD